MAYKEDEFLRVGDSDLAAQDARIARKLVSKGNAVLAAPEVVFHLKDRLLPSRGKFPHFDVLVRCSVGEEAVLAERA